MSSSNNNNNSGSDKYVEPSDSSFYKGYGGQKAFLECHGLKIWNDDDIQEGKAILRAMKAADREDWEAEQAAKKK
ncbi:hypothetical protein BDV98DRAFT_570160 [Pterulicium gracile]|uniref:Uncharacterized protein n=1 Tax=Pterulicium gracile TaxID=1884261 RepID=A0A5C3QGE4_9AGAR|nr:hypothetical protein BDV98DRAFT_570160 [Pterula gracilis]